MHAVLFWPATPSMNVQTSNTLTVKMQWLRLDALFTPVHACCLMRAARLCSSSASLAWLHGTCSVCLCCEGDSSYLLLIDWG